jgi:DNA-directed RNA polymerase subunit M/transcription elongation factor TFIIS
MAPSSIQTVVLVQNGEVKQTKIPSKDVSLEAIQKVLKSKQEIDLVATYEWDNNYIFMFGAIDGKAGTENQHELPPPHDSNLIFGDILVIVSTEKNYTNPVIFTTLNYEKFYQHVFEGFDDSDDDEEVVDEEEDVVVDEEEDEEEVVVEEEEEEEEAVIAEDEDEEEAPIQKVQPKKKASTAPVTARTKQQMLLQTPGFKELIIGSKDDNTTHVRETIKNIIRKTLPEINNSDLEMAIFNSAIKESERIHVVSHWKNHLFENVYKTVARRVITNLDKNSPVKNNRLIQRLHDNEFTMDELATKNSYDLFPEQWKELSDRQIQREQRLLEGNKGMATNIFKCHGCGKRECTYYEMQTRSADEPMTIFITCLNCGKRWKQ